MLLPTNPIGFVGERKAIALLCLVFYVAFYGLMSLLMANAPPDQPELREWWGCFAALAACYGLGFFALASEWFWARWFAVGLGYSGLTMAGWGIIMQRSLEPVLVFYGLTHGLIALLLQGEKLTAQFDAKPGWRERLNLDENGVIKVRHSVTRAAASLPTVIMIALAPRESAMGLAVLALAGAGVLGVLTMRTWGVLLLSAGAGLAVMNQLSHPLVHVHTTYQLLPGQSVAGVGFLGAAFLVAAVLPFARPIARYLHSRA